MQSEFGLIWQDLGIRSFVYRPSKFISVSFMWHIKFKKGKRETVLPFFNKLWDLLCIYSCHTEILDLFFFLSDCSGIPVVGTFSEIFIFH